MIRAQQVCGWWPRALTAGWSPPGLQSGRHHRCAAYYLPLSSRSYPGEEPVHTKEHGVKCSRGDNVPSPLLSPLNVQKDKQFQEQASLSFCVLLSMTEKRPNFYLGCVCCVSCLQRVWFYKRRNGVCKNEKKQD